MVDDMTARSATLSALLPGTWYFAVRVFNSAQVESADSNVPSKAVTGTSAAGTVGITITAPTPVPPTPTPPSTGSLVTTSRYVCDVRQQSNGSWSTRNLVGTIALGRPCSSAFTANGGYYPVNRSDVTRNSARARSNIFVARCAVK